ncbi:MAG: tetratricopeptide repeat protein [Halieaceae bacterium]|nr:tetratricopeptide repeat protein [Halieaceae bacterium]
MRFALLITFLFLLSACATTGDPVGQADSASSSGDYAAAPSAAADMAVDQEPPELPERAFPDESVYPLLVAEFALRRREYDLALNTYMQQAEELQDAGVAAHTARLAQFMRRDPAAIRATELWVRLEPENLEARLTLANLLARTGRPGQALTHMEAILRAGGLANFTSLVRGFNSMDPSAQRVLLQRVETLLAEFPDNTQLRLCSVLMLESIGQQEEALAELQPIFDNDPHQVQAVVMDAKLRLDLGRRERAFERVTAALDKQPENTRLRLQYARLLTQTDMAEAERQFQILLDAAPEDPDLLFSMALIQREMNDLESARESLERLLSLNARTDEAHYYLGKTAEDQQRLDDAIMHYMEVQPGRDFGTANDRLAQLMLAAGRSAELGVYFDALRASYPNLAEQLYALEVEKLMGGQHLAEASAVVDRALSEYPESVSLRYSRSIVAERLDNLAEAEADLRRILANDPDNSTALNALGYLLANRTERYAEAEELIARALEINPEEPAILDSWGWVKYRLGEYDEALDYLQRAYRAFPDPEVAAHLGEVLWVMGRDEAAVAIWDQALSTSPEHAILLETIQRLGVDLADR